MKSIRISVVLASAMALAGSSAMFAHHSQSQFEPELTISIEGTLTKASWSNPHTLFVIEGKKAGTADAATEWTVEGPSPRQLETKGWGRTVSKPGDKVTIEFHPLKDGSRGGQLMSATLANGQHLGPPAAPARVFGRPPAQ